MNYNNNSNKYNNKVLLQVSTKSNKRAIVKLIATATIIGIIMRAIMRIMIELGIMITERQYQASIN